MIQENAELITKEHEIQATVDQAGKTLMAMDAFVLELEKVLDQREALIAQHKASAEHYLGAVANFAT